MAVPSIRDRGFSLIEMIVVLAIVGILSVVGVVMIGNRPSGAVRSVMDELEGVLASAHKRAVATGQDVVITTSGEWGVPNIMTVTYTGASGGDNFTLAHREEGGVATAILREHMHAGVVTNAHADWWTTAQGASTDINSIAPFNSATAGFRVVSGGSILDVPLLNLFTGNAAASDRVRISGSSKRFIVPCWIKVVGLSGGLPLPGGPMGVLAVQANGATIYKFYNPGTLNGGNGLWRKI